MQTSCNLVTDNIIRKIFKTLKIQCVFNGVATVAMWSIKINIKYERKTKIRLFFKIIERLLCELIQLFFVYKTVYGLFTYALHLSYTFYNYLHFTYMYTKM